MKQLSVIALIFTLLSCSKKTQSDFFQDCRCTKIDLAESKAVNDTLNSFTIQYPDESWFPHKTLNKYVSQITIADTIKGYIRAFSVLKSNKHLNLEMWQSYNEEVKKDFILLESGDIVLRNKSAKWSLVEPKDQTNYKILFVTLFIEGKNEFYTFNITVENSEDYEQRICEMESLIYGFTLRKQIDN
jgi:hypothetical protein